MNFGRKKDGWFEITLNGIKFASHIHPMLPEATIDKYATHLAFIYDSHKKRYL